MLVVESECGRSAVGAGLSKISSSVIEGRWVYGSGGGEVIGVKRDDAARRLGKRRLRSLAGRGDAVRTRSRGVQGVERVSECNKVPSDLGRTQSPTLQVDRIAGCNPIQNVTIRARDIAKADESARPPKSRT